MGFGGSGAGGSWGNAPSEESWEDMSVYELMGPEGGKEKGNMISGKDSWINIPMS